MFKIIRNTALATAAAAAVLAGQTAPANAGNEPYIGETMLVGFSFCPRGWFAADGQILAISQYTALYSLFGTYYGGDGRSTFALPDLRGRVPLSQGSGPGLSNITIGQRSGAESVVLGLANLPSHNHTATAASVLNGTGSAADKGVVAGNSLARSGATQIYSATAPAVPMADGSVTTSVTVQNNGGSQPVGIQNPYVGMQWCIAYTGIFPPRS